MKSGEKKVQSGKKAVKKAEKQRKKGETDIERGKREIAEGQKRRTASEDRFCENFPDLPLNADEVQKPTEASAPSAAQPAESAPAPTDMSTPAEDAASGFFAPAATH